MNETDSRALALNLTYAYFRDGDLGWTGYARTLDDAQQACQGAATGPLCWASERHGWCSQDPANGVRYVIGQLPFLDICHRSSEKGLPSPGQRRFE